MTLGAIQSARDRSRRLYNGRNYQTAYVNGAMAAVRGRAKDENPYKYAPGTAGYYRAWDSGYLSIAAPSADFE